MLASWHWHIEMSSKCTLKCPRCARQEVPDSLINTELNLDFFIRNFTPEFIQHNVEKITFCGDDGDPIYAHDLIPVIKYFKSIKPVEIVIVTNGSYKSAEWWADLGSVLNKTDTVHFSIDGYDDESNNLYRVNSDYDSICLGIHTLRKNSDCIIVWDTIAFSFNQDHLLLIDKQANALGCDTLQITKSTKFGSVYPAYGTNDSLEPKKELISSTHRFEREFVQLTDRNTVKEYPINLELYNKVKDNNIIPLCEIGNKGVFINSQGFLYPCCWVANRYNHNNEWQELSKKFNLYIRSLTDVLSDDFWSGDFQSFRWQECQTKCSKGVVNEKYATLW